MACECPVIASNLSAVRDLIEDGKDGLLVKPGDELALARSIIYLLENSHVAKEIGQKARRKIESEFCWEKVGYEYAKIIQSFA
jgi:glycosyltransferase involved in cell wall biosynthesis